MQRFPVPRILVSRCLGFGACRYDGQMLSCELVERLKQYADMLPVCPEAEAGLGTPRVPIRLYEEDGLITIYQPATDTDVTNVVNSFIDPFIAHLPTVDGAILKSKSPSCGLIDVKVYVDFDKPNTAKRTSGIFGGKVLRCLGVKAVEDEARLADCSLREHFLTKLFTLAWFRRISEAPSMGGLVAFHAANKLLFMAYNQSRFRAAGSIAANHGGLPVAEVIQGYRRELDAILQKPFRSNGIINSLHHALGWISDELDGAERKYLVDFIEEYRDERIPLQAVTRLIQSHAIRHKNTYLMGQSILAPYPRGLVDLDDGGRGEEGI